MESLVYAASKHVFFYIYHSWLLCRHLVRMLFINVFVWTQYSMSESYSNAMRLNEDNVNVLLFTFVLYWLFSLCFCFDWYTLWLSHGLFYWYKALVFVFITFYKICVYHCLLCCDVKFSRGVCVYWPILLGCLGIFILIS